jgi:hypothetical protein
MIIRRILFVMVTAFASMLGVLSVGPANAEAVITASWNTDQAHLGDTVTLTVTFTNPETVDVTFTYLGMIESYPTITSGLEFTEPSYAGEISDPSHYTVPIAPGASRTMTETFGISPDSQCRGNADNIAPLQFLFYSYRESAAGAFDLIAGGPIVSVHC